MMPPKGKKTSKGKGAKSKSKAVIDSELSETSEPQQTQTDTESQHKVYRHQKKPDGSTRAVTFPLTPDQKDRIYSWFEENPQLWNKSNPGYILKNKEHYYIAFAKTLVDEVNVCLDAGDRQVCTCT